MRPGRRTIIEVNALRAIRDGCRYWYKYAMRNDAPQYIRDEYIGAWGVLSDLVLEVNH